MKQINGGVTAAKGFKAASCEANIKYKDRTDMAFVYSEEPCVCAGTFTSNVVKAACGQWDQKIVASGEPMQAVVINSGIANACTGKEGFDACEATAKAVEKCLGVKYTSVAVASTGVIGMQLPVDKLVKGVEVMSIGLDGSIDAGTAASKAIMTTDTVNKEVAVTFEIGGKEVTLGGMSKGSGMIHPNMCTMLAYVTTDAAISQPLLQEALSADVVDSFNMISVDGDTSTNDTLLLMANGLAGNAEITEKGEAFDTFCEALHMVTTTLAKMMAGDGEGATALFEVQVVGADTKENARVLAKSVITSSLTKAAIFGHDANWGRILCALGYSGVQFDPENIELWFEGKNDKMLIFKDGVQADYSEEEATKILSEECVHVTADMKMGNEEATAWGCDLTYDYVKINADYRS
jgi:glutamate N-acetyltransferase/amino-acid N-acetyltransferase